MVFSLTPWMKLGNTLSRSDHLKINNGESEINIYCDSNF